MLNRRYWHKSLTNEAILEDAKRHVAVCLACGAKFDIAGKGDIVRGMRCSSCHSPELWNAESLAAHIRWGIDP